ncbi:MAG: TRAP transporter large permease [Planctomycetes bacterium]|nr:TRAP transporter large permease [Planctomycetota bacterium]
MLICIFAILLFLILVTGAPILLALGSTGLFGIMLTDDLANTLFAQKIFAMIDSYSLLAMPFFILAGSLMSRGGISKYLVEFAEICVGHLRAGLAHSAVLASMIFANVSGSSVAGTTAVGTILIPAMKAKGYKAGFAAALVASAGTIAPIIPPSMTMVVYGSMTGVSIGGLFLAGIIPGILLGMSLMTAIVIQSRRPGNPELRVTAGRRFDLWLVIKSLHKVWVALLAPVIILGGILSGVFTATEAGVVTVFYALFVGLFIYQNIHLKDIPKILLDAALTTTSTVGVIAMAGAIGWLLAYLDFNDIVLRFIQSFSTNRTVVVFALLAFILVLTMFIESLAVLVIMIPVCVYVAAQYGFNAYHFGLLMVLTAQIGAVTPPVAVLLFVATSIAEIPYDQTIKYCLPFIIALVTVLALIVFFPPLASYIPNHFIGVPGG